ncbi:MAG TPA: response regulator [Roseomonas sp.]
MPVPAEATASRTVLVVDDEWIIAAATGMMLRELGWQVVEAHSAAQAIAHLDKGGALDLLITDYSMPKMNGGQLARHARDLHPALPILITTGYSDVPGGLEAGVRALRKPYMLDQLRSAIEGLLGSP